MTSIKANARQNRVAALGVLEERRRAGKVTPRNGRPLFSSSRSGF